MVDLAASKAAPLARLVRWWFAGPHAVVLDRYRRLLSHLWYVDKPDAWADPGNAVYGVALAWLYEELPASHECWSVINGNSLGNVMEGLLGIMWAEVNLKDHDLESFRRISIRRNWSALMALLRMPGGFSFPCNLAWRPGSHSCCPTFGR